MWFDALINYIAAVGYGADDARFRAWWPADLHVVGKDITRFHAVVWPAMLMSAGLALPRRVFGHGWVNWKGRRMSKSLGTSVDPLEAADRLGPDPLRLYLVKEIAYGHDGDFTWERFEERYNADLANNLGNLVNRVAVMAHKYRGGRLAPVPGATPQLADRAADVVRRYRAAMDEHQLHTGIAAAFDLVDATNEFITRSEPWVSGQGAGPPCRIGSGVVRDGRGGADRGDFAVACDARLLFRDSETHGAGRADRRGPARSGHGVGGRGAADCQGAAALATDRGYRPGSGCGRSRIGWDGGIERRG